MTIYSWNMLFRNRELDRAFEFIKKSDFDIFCLQEVPGKFFERLRTLPYQLAETIDADRLFRKPNRAYIVTLSRYPIIAHKEIFYPSYWDTIPWYGKLYIHSLRVIGWSRAENRRSLWTKIQTPSGDVNVFNLHLTLTTPAARAREFEQSLIERDPRAPAIVGGDFNIIESPRVSLLNWLSGGSLSDALRYRRERTHIERRFVEHELANPLRGKNTHAFAGSQLDHILVSRSFSITDAYVLPDRVGSDHHPIRVFVGSTGQ